LASPGLLSRNCYKTHISMRLQRNLHNTLKVNMTMCVHKLPTVAHKMLEHHLSCHDYLTHFISSQHQLSKNARNSIFYFSLDRKGGFVHKPCLLLFQNCWVNVTILHWISSDLLFNKNSPPSLAEQVRMSQYECWNLQQITYLTDTKDLPSV
jgi:hypothetical protein